MAMSPFREWEEMKKNGESDYWTALAAEVNNNRAHTNP